jgi:hypothetical protein
MRVLLPLLLFRVSTGDCGVSLEVEVEVSACSIGCTRVLLSMLLTSLLLLLLPLLLLLLPLLLLLLLLAVKLDGCCRVATCSGTVAVAVAVFVDVAVTCFGSLVRGDKLASLTACSTIVISHIVYTK